MIAYQDIVLSKYGQPLLDKIQDVSDRLDWNPSWLTYIMNHESGISHTIQNTKYPVDGGYATGFIQFIPSTARGLGTTTEKLKNMSAIQQMDYVYKHFLPFRNKIKSVYDLYLVVFFPAALGKSDDETIGTSKIPATAVGKSNPIFDLNKDGVITIAEFKKRINNTIPVKYKELIFGKPKLSVKKIIVNPKYTAIAATLIIGCAGLATTIFLVLKQK